MKHARVVVIVPVYNEARHLPRMLESIEAQTFDRERLFVVVADGNSSDDSAGIVRRWLERSGLAGCVVSNSRRTIPTALNSALEQATDDDIIVRLDAHSICGPTYIADAVGALENSSVDVGCVGCVACPAPGTNLEQRVVEALYTNPMGLGGTSGTVSDEVREVDSVYLGTWRPGLLKRLGGFNETMEANEDGEMAARLRNAGYLVLRVPLPCNFLIKRGILSAIRQWNRYGYWRSKMLQRNPQFVRLRHIASPLALLFACALAFSPLRAILLPLAALYALCVYWGRAKGESPAVTLAAIAFFPVLQCSFAIGMLTGLATGRGRDWPLDVAHAPSVQISS